MTEAITPEIFEHLSQLAALELDPSEAEYLRKQLNNQLRSVQELVDIQLDPSVATTSHGVPYTPSITPALRSDEWIPDPSPPEILDQAPEVEDGYIIVPEILHEELE
jgi:aspartyl-tRNA(Asn)/glutamyl-tRNA(Gln) amidotransferase subunit C